MSSDSVRSPGSRRPLAARLRRDLPLYLLVLPGVLHVFVFKYLPMGGILIAFENYSPAKGILGSDWVGFHHFVRFLSDPFFVRVMRNTLLLGFYSLVLGFPAPIVLALLLNEVRNAKVKRVIQTISYMPYFISIVIVVGILRDMTGLSTGVVNDLLETLGARRINFFDRPEWFRTLYVLSGIWHGVGFGSIIYLAALAGINVELYESAVLDGANRLRQAVSITLPSLLPTISILLILEVGQIVNNNFQKILLMYSPTTYETADVIQTYVYRAGIEGASFSYSSAVGVFLSVVAFVLLYVTNRISRSAGAVSLW